MKYPHITGTLALAVVGMIINLSFTSHVDARIGESKPQLEARLLARGGVAYRDDAIIEARREGMVYEEFLPYLHSNVDIQIYHKPADSGTKAKRSEFSAKRMSAGWDLHVIYINGTSALELYQRSGKITDQELNLLLSLQGDGKNWSKRETDGLEKSGGTSLTEKEKKNMTAFGFQMVRNDGAVRAKKVSKGILFVDAERDAQFANARDNDLNSSAPESVNGF
ncbi:MAG: hypothetical protein ACSHX8_03865 [Opitutaceae bacterium]